MSQLIKFRFFFLWLLPLSFIFLWFLLIMLSPRLTHARWQSLRLTLVRQPTHTSHMRPWHGCGLRAWAKSIIWYCATMMERRLWIERSFAAFRFTRHYRTSQVWIHTWRGSSLHPLTYKPLIPDKRARFHPHTNFTTGNPNIPLYLTINLETSSLQSFLSKSLSPHIKDRMVM